MKLIALGNPWNEPALIDLAAHFEQPEPAMLAAITLWAWCAENCPDGLFIGDNAAAQIELAARWNGERAALVKALLETCLIEIDEDGLCVVNYGLWNAPGSKEGGDQ